MGAGLVMAEDVPAESTEGEDRRLPGCPPDEARVLPGGIARMTGPGFTETELPWE